MLIKYRSYYLALGLLALFIALSLIIHSTYLDIGDATQTSPPVQQPAKPPQPTDTVRVGVISRFYLNLIYEGYQPIMDYLNSATPYHFILKPASTYEETIGQLDRGEIQAAFLGTYIYLKTRHHHPIKCILKPLNSHFEPYFHSVLITRSDSPIRSIADLAGRRLALPSSLSFSGNWVLRSALEKYGLRASDLDSIHYFGFHHTVVYEVLRGHFDAGAVKDRVAEEFVNKGIRILASSEPIPGSPIIVRSGLDSAITSAIRRALLQVDIRKPEYRELVKDWDAEFAYGFAPAEDADYDQMASIFGLTGEAP